MRYFLPLLLLPLTLLGQSQQTYLNPVYVAASSGCVYTNITSGLVAWYYNLANPTTTDGSGNGYTWTATNNPTVVSTISGNGLQMNPALSQSVGSVSGTSGPANVIAGTSHATLCAWMLTTNGSGNNSAVIGFSNPEHRLNLAVSGGAVYCQVENGAAYSYPSVSYTPDTNWHFYALCYNGGGANLNATCALYIDAVPQTLTTGGAAPATTLDTAANLTSFTAGDTENSLTFNAQSQSQTWLFSRTLSAGEITNLFLRGTNCNQ